MTKKMLCKGKSERKNNGKHYTFWRKKWHLSQEVCPRNIKLKWEMLDSFFFLVFVVFLHFSLRRWEQQHQQQHRGRQSNFQCVWYLKFQLHTSKSFWHVIFSVAFSHLYKFFWKVVRFCVFNFHYETDCEWCCWLKEKAMHVDGDEWQTSEKSW